MKRREAEEFCGKWLPAWTGNQANALIEFYSDNAVYVDPANKEGIRGRDQILQYFRKLLAANPDWRWEAIEVFPTDHGFTCKWRATIPIGPETIIENGMDIVEIRTSKITRNEVYFDRSGLLDALKKRRGAKT
ncbi:MAG: nuclear transport factor 2 family protein [Promethearchaeati archaeon SRVP18_Atabeyarchaeia-1]